MVAALVKNEHNCMLAAATAGSDAAKGLGDRAAELQPFEVSFATFGPLETERIAGIPHHLQRLWRYRGHLPSGRRYTPSRFSSAEIAELCVRYRLSSCSVPPAQSADLGKNAGPIVLLSALSLVDGAVELVGPPSDVEGLAGSLGQKPDLTAAICGIEWSDASRYLWSADGAHFQFRNTLLEEFPSSHDLQVAIDLVSMGTRIALDAGRPLLTLRHRSGGDQLIRRIRGTPKGFLGKAPRHVEWSASG
jgi:hypothetical protein